MRKSNSNVVYKYQDMLVIKPPCSDFDFDYSTIFRTDFSLLIDRYGYRVIILDFSSVVFIDESGLAAILNSWHQCSKKGMELILCNLNELSYSFIEKKAIHKIIQITYSLNDAIKLGNIYSKKMQEFCQNAFKMNNVFGDLGDDKNIPTVCELFSPQIKLSTGNKIELMQPEMLIAV